MVTEWPFIGAHPLDRPNVTGGAVSGYTDWGQVWRRDVAVSVAR